MKKIIVTGGLGFIGSNLIDLLLKKNYSVINVDKATYSSNYYNVKDFKNSKKYKFVKLDIKNKNFEKILFKYKPIGIFNLAAETHVDRSIDNPDSFIQSNIVGVYNLLESFKNFTKKNKSKLIHISTDEVYGDILSGRSDEKYSYQPSSPYAASKASSDHLVSSYVRTYNLPAIVTNCSNNYGPKQHPEKLIPKLIYNILNNKPLPIYGKGKNSREWIYVKDHCEGLLTIYKKGITGENYNIGSNYNINNLNLTKILLEIFKSKKINIGKKVKIKFVTDRPGHDFRYALNSKKIRKKLNWKPKKSFKTGLSETLDWYIKNYKFFGTFSKKNFFRRLGLKI